MHRPTQYRAPRGYAALLLGSLTIHLGFAALAEAQEPTHTHNYTVAAQALNGALTDFADQSDLKLMFPAELARGLASPGVTGTLTRDQALTRLLAGTGLEYRYTGPGTVTLQTPRPPGGPGRGGEKIQAVCGGRGAGAEEARSVAEEKRPRADGAAGDDRHRHSASRRDRLQRFQRHHRH